MRSHRKRTLHQLKVTVYQYGILQRLPFPIQRIHVALLILLYFYKAPLYLFQIFANLRPRVPLQQTVCVYNHGDTTLLCVQFTISSTPRVDL